MSERSHHHNPAAHSRSRPTREKGAVPFQLIGHHQLRTPRFHSPPCLGNGGSWIAGSRRLPLFPRKEGQARAELPHREPLTMHANRPLKDIACVLHAQTKDATVVCVIGCQITRTRIHTLPKRLASARHSRVRKLYSYQIHSARFKQTSQWRRKSWWCILPAALILWYAGSDVMGCRRPTGGVFSYVSSDRVTLRAFPVATPRGRSSSSHEGELSNNTHTHTHTHTHTRTHRGVHSKSFVQQKTVSFHKNITFFNIAINNKCFLSSKSILEWFLKDHVTLKTGVMMLKM